VSEVEDDDQRDLLRHLNRSRNSSGLHGIGNLSVRSPDKVSRFVQTDHRANHAPGVDPNPQLDVHFTCSADDLHVVLHMESELEASHGVVLLTLVTRKATYHHKGIADGV
jgi:hypothetical protein